jgi:hypothetical protein
LGHFCSLQNLLSEHGTPPAHPAIGPHRPVSTAVVEVSALASHESENAHMLPVILAKAASANGLALSSKTWITSTSSAIRTVHIHPTDSVPSPPAPPKNFGIPRFHNHS